MHSLPIVAKFADVLIDDPLDFTQLACLKSVILSKLGGAVPAIQDEYCFSVRPPHVNTRRTMVVSIDHDPEPFIPQNRGAFQLILT